MVQASNENINIEAMYLSSFFQRFAGGRGAAYAMHTHAEEYLSSVDVSVENLLERHVFSDFSHN